MKKLITTGLFAILANCALALTETVDGIEWLYDVSYGKASLGDGSWDAPAISTSTTGAIIIPSTLGGYPVTSIGWRAFRNCSELTSVTIPDSVTSIEAWAFASCSGLTSVTIGNGVKYIGDGAFYDCIGLTNVYITDISNWCGIKYESFDATPLYFAHKLYLNGEEVTALTIPDSVTSIGDYAFKNCSGLTSVTIPDSVTSIGSYAFENCSGLTSVTIPDSVMSLWPGTFRGCSGLTSFVVSEMNPSYCSKNGLLLSKDGKTLVCGVNGDVTIPDSVTSIGEDAFFGCSGLTSVTIPDSVTSIGISAFYGCSSLMEFVVSEAHPLYKAINGLLLTKDGKTLVYGVNGDVTIPDSVTSIGEDAFEGCSGLTSVTIPDSVTSIGYEAFYGCSGLTSVTIPDSVTSIGRHAFEDCSGLTSVTIGNSVTNIGKEAFHGCSGLTSVSIPSSVTEIGEDAFKDTKLEKVYVDVGDTENVKALLIVSGYSNIRGITFIEGKMAVAPSSTVATKAMKLLGAVYDGNDVVGIVELKVGKVNVKKGTCKVSGTVTTLDGKKHAIKAVNIAGVNGKSSMSASFEVKDLGTMNIKISGTQFTGSLGGYNVKTAEVGGAWSGSGATVMVEANNVSMFAGAVLEGLLPMPEEAKVAGGKWKFDKATGVKWANPKKGAAKPELYDEASGKGLIVDEAGGKTNRSAMKLTYTPKKGTFKGSFKVYVLEGEGKATKLKKYNVGVSGLVVGGEGYGTATCKKPAAKWSVTVK